MIMVHAMLEEKKHPHMKRNTESIKTLHMSVEHAFVMLKGN